MLKTSARVLIVDDNPAKLTALTAALSGIDIEIITATSGTEALHQLLTQQFAVVLLDVNMPVLNGFETAEIIRLRPSSEQLPIIFITAEQLSNDARLQGYGLGAVDYILSPVLPQILRSKVAVFADLYRLRAQVMQQNQLLETQVAARTAELQMSEARYRRITEGLTDYQYTVYIENGRAIKSTQSLACVTVTGYTAEEFAHNPHLWIDMVVSEDRGRVNEYVRQVMAGKECAPLEHRIVRKDGATRWVSDTAILFKDDTGKLLSYDGVIKDITERRLAEALAEQAQHVLESLEAKYHALFELSADAHMLLDAQGFIDCNPATLRLFGCRERGDFIHKHPSDLSPLNQPNGENSRELANQHITTAFQNGNYSFEWMHCRLDGSEFPADVLLTALVLDGQSVLKATVRDITQRKLAEANLQQINRTLAALSIVNRTLVHALDENELLQAICNAVVEQNGYRLAWVGYVLPDNKIKIMANSSPEQIDALQPIWAEYEICNSTWVCQDLAHDENCLPWRDAALNYGLCSFAALPLQGQNQMVFGILVVYSGKVNSFSPQEVKLLEEMAEDMAFGVNAMRVRHERDQGLEKIQQHLKQLQDSLENTVRALAAIGEMRDPYTAGHQVRVADLAAAIASKMGLSEDRVHAVHLAGFLHDIGKIKVPAEILSKPGKISNAEYTLIKDHPEAGYEILKDIDFPWAIAQMVLQHHERLDGSGYPNGLKGDEILLEARIICVADVAEAMTSHRPYRVGLGIDFALAEITKQRGIHYDPAVVDACVALFREQTYSLP